MSNDATVAVAIAARLGLASRTKYVNVKSLWIPEGARAKALMIQKVDTAKNVADVLTKFFRADVMDRNLRDLGVKFAEGRSTPQNDKTN